MLTPSEFAGQYRAGKPKASNKEVARAYNAYVENNSVDDSEFAASPALDLDIKTEPSSSSMLIDKILLAPMQRPKAGLPKFLHLLYQKMKKKATIQTKKSQ